MHALINIKIPACARRPHAAAFKIDVNQCLNPAANHHISTLEGSGRWTVRRNAWETRSAARQASHHHIGQDTAALLSGRSARIIVTMGMLASVYRLWFGGHGVNGFVRSILDFAGVSPVRHSLFGMVQQRSDATRARWLARMKALGRRGL
jgi:hypothetical protein